MLSFREKQMILTDIFKRYKGIKLAETYHYIEESSKHGYIRFIDYLLNHLSEEHARLLRMEFLEDAQPFWWMEYYSRSTFYRMKTKAMNEFLICLEYQKMIIY